MGICINCLKSKADEYLFCPWCGYPAGKTGFRKCRNGHLIYETFKSCVFCDQADNVGVSMIHSRKPGLATEILAQPGEAGTPVDRTVLEPEPVDKTVLESDSGLSLTESAAPGKTRIESNVEAAISEGRVQDRTRLEDSHATALFEGGLPGMAHSPSTVVEEEGYLKKDEKGYEAGTRLDMSGNHTRVPEQAENLSSFFARLVCIGADGLTGKDIHLDKEKIIIGKGDDADLKVNDDFVSRLHALVYFEKNRFYISDLGSTNGTFLNERKVLKEILKDGDRIRVGNKNIIFKCVTRPCSSPGEQ